jgi:hypothetical protein
VLAETRASIGATAAVAGDSINVVADTHTAADAALAADARSGSSQVEDGAAGALALNLATVETRAFAADDAVLTAPGDLGVAATSDLKFFTDAGNTEGAIEAQ